jgi:hypothetical protein
LLTKYAGICDTTCFKIANLSRVGIGSSFCCGLSAMASDGSTQDYVVTVSVAAPSTNADLSALSINQGSLSPSFSTATLSYTVDVANSVVSITVTGTRSDANATLSSNSGVAQDLAFGANTITIRVTAQDGTTTKDYVVTVTRAPTCTDYVRNGTETDVDCGGGTCPKCADNKMCTNGPRDCASGNCTGNLCLPPTCADGIQNGSESAIDCGGSSCAKCTETKSCRIASDCISGVCITSVCRASTCTDLVRNGTETDVDCGGGTCPGCAAGKICTNGPIDCASGNCTGNRCAP